MECKFDTAEREAYKIGELIDTLWNVNSDNVTEVVIPDTWN